MSAWRPPGDEPPVSRFGPDAPTLTLSSVASAVGWARADALLDEALDLDPAERGAWLDRACGADANLRAQLERLLARAHEGDGFLGPGGALAGTFGAALARDIAADDGDTWVANDDLSGRRIDRYAVLREIGRGGMAVVYLAERADGQFEQLVALKVMGRGVDAAPVVARFRQERQILARTRHPGIAALLDGGVTPDGRPYFVMEYVDGRPIDRFCDEERLGVPQRLALFLQVARAVEHAHHNLVVHRDIKPSNILVSADGRAKLLDFGIAKRLDTGLESEALTRADERLLTPAFASPEQLMGEPITTATDVYQLGLLLYVLLTGRGAYGDGARGPQSLMRAVVEEMPARPSVVVGQAATMRASADTALLAPVAAFVPRRPASARLRHELRGDLDNIVLMALRKEPTRRYGDVGQLAEDVERYLQGLPVRARADTPTYRAAKFVRRHALAISGVALATLLVAALVAAHTRELARERDRARRAAAQAAQVADFLQGLFRVAAPSRASGERLTARELLERGAARIPAELADQPELQASMLTLVGGVYRELALYDEARPVLERALALRRAMPEGERAGLAETLTALGRLRHDMGAQAEARTLLEAGLGQAEAAGGPDSLAVAEAADALGNLLRETGDLSRARALLERALALREARLGLDHPDVGRTLKTLARVRGALDGFEQTRQPLERARRILEAAHGPEHPHVAEVRAYLGDALRLTGELAGAGEHYRAALRAFETAYGPEHPEVGRVLAKFGHLLCDQGRVAEARATFERSLSIRQAAFGARHPAVASSLNGLGRVQLLAAHPQEAQRLFEQSASIYSETLGPEHVDTAGPLLNLAELLAQRGQPTRALELAERVLAVRERAYGAGHTLLERPRALIARLRASRPDPAPLAPGPGDGWRERSSRHDAPCRPVAPRAAPRRAQGRDCARLGA
jgi:serine/threonine-protein kinase